MAHSLGLRVIAEGVETEAQCNFLRLNMCATKYRLFLPADLLTRDAYPGICWHRDQRLWTMNCVSTTRQRSLLLVDEPNITSQRLLTGRENLQILITPMAGRQAWISWRDKRLMIISDQRMPGMTGVEFLENCQNRYRYLRIVLSGTGNAFGTEAVNDGAIYKFLKRSDQQLCDCIEEPFWKWLTITDRLQWECGYQSTVGGSIEPKTQRQLVARKNHDEAGRHTVTQGHQFAKRRRIVPAGNLYHKDAENHRHTGCRKSSR